MASTAHHGRTAALFLAALLSAAGGCSSGTHAHAGSGGSTNSSVGSTGSASSGGGLAAGSTISTVISLNFRSGPSMSASVIGSVPANTSVTVVDPTIEDDYIQVQYMGTTGWLDAEWLSSGSETCYMVSASWNLTYTFQTSGCSLTKSIEIWAPVTYGEDYPGAGEPVMATVHKFIGSLDPAENALCGYPSDEMALSAEVAAATITKSCILRVTAAFPTTAEFCGTGPLETGFLSLHAGAANGRGGTATGSLSATNDLTIPILTGDGGMCITTPKESVTVSGGS